MIGYDERRAAVTVQLAAHAADAGLGRKQVGRGDLAQRDDELRPDQLDLAVQVRLATQRFAGLRIAVARGPAFDAIRDIDAVAAPDTDRREHIVQQPAGLADERLALRILLGARAFTDEHPVGVLVADTEHGLVALLMQRTIRAGGHALLERLPIHAHDRFAALVARGRA